MSIEPRNLRQTVGHFVTGVTVVAIATDETVHAMTANSFTSLSLEPPLVLFCAGKATRVGQLSQAGTKFCVSILQQHQRDLSSYFAGVWKAEAPPAFTFEPWQGGPFLQGSAAGVACEVVDVHEGGDHWIVVGRVVAVRRLDDGADPLVFHAGRYAALVPTA
jgi:flavin reductase (DIM6/NTAB) family NADH-FMN oxidoreductase RutF